MSFGIQTKNIGPFETDPTFSDTNQFRVLVLWSCEAVQLPK